jgi:hypothetical protein
MMRPRRRWLALAAAVTLVACNASVPDIVPSGPPIVVDAGLTPRMTPDEAWARVMEDITRFEARLGRTLAPARIIAMRYVAEGTEVPIFTKAGARPPADMGQTVKTQHHDGWIVEAEGTFVFPDPPEEFEGHATHAYYAFDDVVVPGGGHAASGYHYLPCWWNGPPLVTVVEAPPCP